MRTATALRPASPILLLFLAILPAVAARPAGAVDRTWTGGGVNNEWTNPSNWNPAGVPQAGDAVFITSGTGVVNLDGSGATVAALTLGATRQLDVRGLLTVTGAVTVQGGATLNLLASITAGSLSNTATIRTDAGVTLSVSGAATNSGTMTLGSGHLILDTDLVNTAPGTVQWGQANLTVNAGHTFTNEGLVEYVGDFASGLGAGTIRNVGTLQINPPVAAPNRTLNMDVPFVNEGAVEVVVGMLRVTKDSRWEDATVSVAAGATLWLNNSGHADHTVAGTLSGAPAGRFLLSGGDIALRPDPVRGARLDLGGTGLELEGGTVGGSVPLVNDGLVVQSGTMTFNTDFVNSIGATYRWGQANLVVSTAHTFTNEGLVEYVGDFASGLGAGTIRNVGTLQINPPVAAPNRTLNMDVPFVNEGAVVVVVGTLRVTKDSRWEDATVSVAAGATLWLNNSGHADHTVAGTLSGTPAGHFVLSGGDVTLRPDPVRGARLDLGGTGLSLEGGSVAGDAPFVNAGLLNRPGFGSILLDVNLTNTGTFLWQASGLAIGSGRTFLNEGTFEFQGDFSTLARGAGPGPWTFRNRGLLRSAPAAGSNETLIVDVALVNEERVEIVRGQLRIDREIRNLSAGVIAGTGRLRLLNNPVVVNEGTIAPGLPLGTLTFEDPFPIHRLEIEVASAASSDRLVFINGAAATLDAESSLLMRPVGGFVLAPGQTYTVLTANGIGGAFGVVGSPQVGVGFSVSTAGGQAVVTVTDPGGGGYALSPASPVGGDLRTVYVTGPSFAGGATVRLECTDCLDPTGQGTIAGQVINIEGGLMETRFDLGHVRAFGFYDLVLEQPALPAVRLPVAVRPFLSVPLYRAVGPFGVPVLPAPAYLWGEVRVLNLTNAVGPSFPPIDVTMPEETAVRVQLNSVGHGYGTPLYDRPTAADPARALLFYRVNAGAEAPINLGTGLSPEFVQFPDMPAGPGLVPFGAEVAIGFDGRANTSLSLTTGAVGAAVRSSGHAGLTNYIAQVDAADAGAVTRAARGELLRTTPVALNARELLVGLIGALAVVVAPPPGLGDAAALAFEGAMRPALTDGVSASYGAIRDALALPAGGVPALVQGELDALRAAGGAAQGLPADREFGEGCQTSFNGNAGQVANILDQMENPGPPQPPPPACEPVRGPFDPNDKTTQTDLACEVGTVIVEGEPVERCVRYFVPLARVAEPVVYSIHFENAPIATAPAEFVTVIDTLDALFDPSTLEVLGTSSDSTFTYSVSGPVVTFRFTGIDLPPNVNAPEGEGFVQFRVTPFPILADGDSLRNRADILFDFNPPIGTPSVIHRVRQVADPAVSVAPLPPEIRHGQPFTATFTVANEGSDAAPGTTFSLAVPPSWEVLGAIPSAGTCSTPSAVSCALGELAPGGAVTIDVTLRPGPQGTAVLTAATTTTVWDADFFDSALQLSIDVQPGVGIEDDGVPLTFALDDARPNPARGLATLRFAVPTVARVTLTLYDALGREVARLVDDEERGPGWHDVALDGRGLAAGVYLYRMVAGDFTDVRRMTLLR